VSVRASTGDRDRVSASVRRVLVIAAILAFGAVLVGPLACRQIVGIGSSPETDLTTSVCGLPYGTNTCAACAQAHCCAESSACAADPLFCAPYESCLGACGGDPACRSRCTIDNPVPTDNAAPVSALSACLASNCESACGLTCGGFAGYLSEPDASAACASCLRQGNACTDQRSCGSSAECDTFWRCWLACITPDCRIACEQQHDAGAATFQPLYADFSSICSTPCGYGSYWACAGQVHWPHAMSPEVTVTDLVYDHVSKKGVPGAQVTICTNCPCPTATNGVLGQGLTNDGGIYTITFQPVISVLGEGSTFCTQVTAPEYLPDFAYGEYPPVEPRENAISSLLPIATWGVALLTPAAQMANSTGVGGTFDPARAIFVAANVSDCLGSPVLAGGADISINVRDPMMLAYGGLDAGPDAWPTVPTGMTGLASNQGLFLDVPPDASVTLTATVPGVGPVSQVSVAIAPNTTTEVVLPPTPNP
jgi:hypothetical protein